MGKGGYIGGSTVIYLGSDWFGYVEPQKKPGRKGAALKNPSSKEIIEARKALESKLEANRSKYPTLHAEDVAVAPDQILQRLTRNRKRIVQTERRPIEPRTRTKPP